jgi:hypothetical protein
MMVNLALEERRVLLCLQRSGPQDTELLADSLDMPLQKTRDTIQSLAEKDLVLTPDGTVAELTEHGESYKLMNDESLEEISDTLSSPMKKIVDFIIRSPFRTDTVSFCRNQGLTMKECVKAKETLESQGYPVNDYID